MIYPQHDEVCQPDSPDLSVKDLTFPLLSFLPPIAERKKEKKRKWLKKRLVDFISVLRVRPRTSKGHHRPVIASNFHPLGLNVSSFLFNTHLHPSKEMKAASKKKRSSIMSCGGPSKKWKNKNYWHLHKGSKGAFSLLSSRKREQKKESRTSNTVKNQPNCFLSMMSASLFFSSPPSLAKERKQEFL